MTWKFLSGNRNNSRSLINRPMKKILSFLAFISSFATAQPNSDAAKIKKEGTRQILLYTRNKSPLPAAVLYYDENGFLTRELSLDWYESEDDYFNYSLADYDSRGRLLRSESGTYKGSSPEHLTFLPDNKFSTTWKYPSDSVIIQTDSSFIGKRLDNVIVKISVTHWKKNNIGIKNRPVFLTDSFPEKEKVTETIYHFYYQSAEINETDEPVRTDSVSSELNVAYTVDSSRMTGNYAWERHNYDTTEQWTNQRIYTLHGHYDTLTWINESWVNLPTAEEKMHGLDNLYYISIQRFTTKKRMHKYIVDMYPAFYKGVLAAEGSSKPRRIKTKDPWHNPNLSPFFSEEFHPEDYTLKFFITRYSPSKITRVK